MRNFKIKRTKPIFISKTAFVNVTLLAGMAIFVALAVLTGRLVSNSIMPDVSVAASATPSGDKIIVTQPTATPEQQPSASPSSGDNTEGSTVTIAARDYYFVQFGVFSNEKNANTCAETIIAKGGAGYIKQDDGKYYVFAMCYTDGNDAQTVVANLKAQGYSTLLKCFSHNGMQLKLSGSNESIENIDSAYSSIVKATDEIEDIIYKFDKGEIDRTELKNMLRTLLDSVGSAKNTFAAYAEQSVIFENARLYTAKLYTDVSALLKLESDEQLKSKLKNTYIDNVFALITYLDNAVVG